MPAPRGAPGVGTVALEPPALGSTSPPAAPPLAAAPALDSAACGAGQVVAVAEPASAACGTGTGGGGTAPTAGAGKTAVPAPDGRPAPVWPFEGSGRKLEVQARTSPAAARTHPYRHSSDTRATNREVATGSGHARREVSRRSSSAPGPGPGWEVAPGAATTPEPSAATPPSAPGMWPVGPSPVGWPTLVVGMAWADPKKGGPVTGADRTPPAAAPGSPRRTRLASSGCTCRAWAWTRLGPTALPAGPAPCAPDDGSTKEPLVTEAPYP